MKDHLQYNLEIKKDKASFKHFMTRYQTLSVDFFLDFLKFDILQLRYSYGFFDRVDDFSRNYPSRSILAWYTSDINVPLIYET